MEELELREYWTIIRKRWLLVLSIPFIAALTSALVSLFVLTPMFAANTTLLVNQNDSTNPMLVYQQITASQALVKTYSDVIKSNTIEQSVIDQLHLPYTQKQFDAMINVTSPDQSQVIQVTVTAPNQAAAAHIANAVSDVFQKRAQVWMNVKNIQIVDPAVVQSHPIAVKPNKKLNVMIAFILGFMVSVGLAFLLEYLDNRLRTEEDVQRYLKLPVLGAIIEYSDLGEV